MDTDVGEIDGRTRTKINLSSKSTDRGASFMEKYEEEVTVASSQNPNLPCCKYLVGGGLVNEITRRAHIAMGVAVGLKSLWKCKRIGKKLKKAIFESLILSIFLYNAEAWEMTKAEEELTRIWYFKLARMTVGKRRLVGNDGTWESNDNFLKQHGLQTLSMLLHKRRVIWLGHLARRVDVDEGAREFFEHRVGPWWERVIHDLTIRGCTVDDITRHKDSRAELMKEVILKKPQQFQ